VTGGFDLKSHWPPRTTPSTSATAETATSAHDPTDRRELFFDVGVVEGFGETRGAAATGGRATSVEGAVGVFVEATAGQGSTFFAGAIGAVDAGVAVLVGGAVGMGAAAFVGGALGFGAAACVGVAVGMGGAATACGGAGAAAAVRVCCGTSGVAVDIGGAAGVGVAGDVGTAVRVGAAVDVGVAVRVGVAGGMAGAGGAGGGTYGFAGTTCFNRVSCFGAWVSAAGVCSRRWKSIALGSSPSEFKAS
jgi:hypothetical protein